MEITSPENRRLSFLHGRKTFAVPPEEIIRLEASSNYTYVYFRDHPPLLMAKVLRRYDEMLRPYGFIRTHHSHLVNVRNIHHLDRNGLIVMSDDSKVGISRRKKREVLNVLLQP